MKHNLLDLIDRASVTSVEGYEVEIFNFGDNHVEIQDCSGEHLEGLLFQKQEVELKNGFVIAFDTKGDDYEFLFTKTSVLTDEDMNSWSQF